MPAGGPGGQEPGVGQGGGRRAVSPRAPASPELPVFVCKVSAGGEPTSACAQRRSAPSAALAPGLQRRSEGPLRLWAAAAARTRLRRRLRPVRRRTALHTPRPRASELSGGAGGGVATPLRPRPRPAPAPPSPPPRHRPRDPPAAGGREKSGDLVLEGFPSVALVCLASETLEREEEMLEEKNYVSPDERDGKAKVAGGCLASSTLRL